MKVAPSDRVFLFFVTTLTLAGLAIFASASLGLLARDTSISISRNILLQGGFGFGIGITAFFIARLIPLRIFKRFAPHLFVVSAILTLLVFVPGLGVHAGGATRWINLHFLTIQPAEFLKIGFVLVLAWWLAPRARQLSNFKTGLLPFSIFIGIPAAILLMQPNTSTTLLIIATGSVMYFVAGAPWRDFGILMIGVIVGLAIIVSVRPYVLERIKTFIDPSANSLGSGYQIQQALIAVGSGGLIGRGFGQSVEKFNYLPEPDGDSVFAVFAEETGFIGATLLLLLFVAFAARGIVIAGNSTDLFGGLVALGFSFLIIFQAFINICAMLGLIPLTGLPLPFISHGGTALAATLLMCGLILNIASRQKS